MYKGVELKQPRECDNLVDLLGISGLHHLSFFYLVGRGIVKT